MSSVISASIMAGIVVIEVLIYIHMYIYLGELIYKLCAGVRVCVHSITYLLHVAYTHCAHIEQLRRAASRIAFASPFALFFIYNLLSLLSLLCCKS